MQPEQLKEIVSELVSFLGLEVSDVSVSTGYRTIVAIASPDSKNLIGPGGEHLRSLNTVARRMVEQKYGNEAASFLVDVNGYQEAQLDIVRDNARKLAQRVRLFKHEVEMDPMSAYDRLVVHECFANDPEIETTSAGEGKFRHIVLKCRVGATPKEI